MDTTENSQPARDPPILRLTPALRRQIYSHVHDALGSEACNLHLHGGNGEAALGIPALLLSCRRIYDEVSEVLYSTNFFDIKCEGAGSLERIRNLSDTSLSLLTELKVVLNEESCHHASCRECCDVYYHPSLNLEGCFLPRVGHKTLHDQALRPSDDSANDLLADWRLASAYIWRRVQPTKLNLSFVCDFDPRDPRTISAASLAMVPLMNLSPLRGCHIRLCRRPHHELQEIARTSVFRACSLAIPEEITSAIKDATTGSMLMSLPRELRFRILEYTDLITPWQEIEWRQKHKKYLYGSMFCGDDQLGCGTGGHHACQFRTCWTDFRERYPEYMDPRPKVGCFCRLRHAAFSFNCRCWSPPTYLFLVSRAFCKDAQVIFFSGNRFLVHDYSDDTPRHTDGTRDLSSHRFAVVEFLRDVVPVDSIHQIRSLDVIMDTFSRDGWQGSRGLIEWKDTVQYMKEKMNIEGLTLSLHLSDSRGRAAKIREVMTKPQVRELLQPLFRILAPLAGLGEEGLKAFSVGFFLSSDVLGPWYLDIWPKGPPTRYYAAEIQKGHLLENRARRLVMGSRYSEQPRRREGLCWSDEELEDVIWNHES